MQGLDRYLRALAGSWSGLAVPAPGAVVVDGERVLASRFPGFPVLNNAVLHRPDALPWVGTFYGRAPYAVWTRADDDEASRTLDAAGLRRDITTRPMLCPLEDVLDEEGGGGVEVRHGVDPRVVAELNAVPPQVLTGVPGLRGVSTAAGYSGLVVQRVGEDVVLSFVATRPDARGRGLATAVTRAALLDARSRGARFAVLQAVPAAERLYARLGFVAVGQWQEWTPR